MAKWTADVVLEAMLTKVATSTRQCICSGQPSNFANISTVLLADNVITPGAGNGDFSAFADGDVSGRKVTILAQSGIVIDANGTANHVTLDDGVALLQVTTIGAPQAVVSGNTANLAAYDFEALDVTP